MHRWDCRCGTPNAPNFIHCRRCGSPIIRGRAVGGPMPATRIKPPPADQAPAPVPFSALRELDSSVDPSTRCMLRVLLWGVALLAVVPVLLAGPIAWLLAALFIGGVCALWTVAVVLEGRTTAAGPDRREPTRPT